MKEVRETKAVNGPSEVRTPRLLLRRFEEGDWLHLRLIDGNPTVMATLGGVRSVSETKAYVAHQIRHWEEHDFGWWVAFDLQSGDFVGRGGVRFIEIEQQVEVEVGYALIPECWGRGLATELARAALSLGFGKLGRPHLVGITLPTNRASRRVLEAVGFRHVRDIVHADLEHLLYRQTSAEWKAAPVS